MGRSAFGQRAARPAMTLPFSMPAASCWALYLDIWDKLADSVGLPAEPRPIAFRGVAIAWNCATTEDVDDLIKAAVAAGARLLGPALKTPWGAYSGYFADPDGHAWEAAYTPGSGFAAAGRVIAPE
jgi:catechol 2,3-dioxygenase-like lactoylglutathione lyase family enzyme